MGFTSDRTFALRLCAAFTLILLFFGAHTAAAQDDLSAAFQRAADTFQPLSDSDIADARDKLVKRMDAVEKWLQPKTAKGKRWLRYLRWDELKNAVHSDKPDTDALYETYQRLNRDETSLELSPFRRLSDSLRNYIQLLQIAHQTDQPAYFRTQIERLRSQLDEYRQHPTGRAEFEIGSRLGFLSSLGQSPELIEAVQNEFGRPNAFVDVSTALVAEAADPINRRESINDVILGTSIHSNTRTVGEVGVTSIPSDDVAKLEFISKGRSHATSEGHKGPAVIHSTSTTDFTASKRVDLSDDEFQVTPSRAHAKTHTNIQSVAKAGGGIGSRLVGNMGWSRARQSKSEAERIAADHAEGRIDRRFNKELNDEIRKARRQYEDDYRLPLQRRGELPEHIRFSSDTDGLAIDVIQANASQLAAAGPPPEEPHDLDMSMRLHQSAVNNYSAAVLSGATASESEPGQDVKFDTKMPKWMKDAWKKRKTDREEPSEAAFKPWSLRFRDGQPISVTFADGKVDITVHMARLTSGDRTFENWDVTGTYKPDLANGGVVLRRDTDLVMMPADAKLDESGRPSLSNRQVAERRNLEEELNEKSAQGRGFPRTVEFDALEPTGALAKAGPLEMRQCVSENGWLTVAWNRQGKPE